MIIITRHKALVSYLEEIGLFEAECDTVLEHARPSDIAGQDVFGVLPLHLAALCASVTVVPLDVPPELRGTELTLEQVRLYAGEPQAYRVERID